MSQDMIDLYVVLSRSLLSPTNPFGWVQDDVEAALRQRDELTGAMTPEELAEADRRVECGDLE